MNLRHWMIHTVTRAPASTPSAHGDPTWGTQTTIAARVERNSKSIVNGQGEQIAPEHWFVTDSAVAVTDAIWLPGDNTSGKPRRVQAVKYATDMAGVVTLYEVYL